MNLVLINSFRSEWLKKRRSLASWLIVVGGLFTPVVVIAARLIRHDRLQEIYAAANFWNSLWKSSWESMAIFFLPMGAILATSLMTQIEFKNNAWKQVHALPLHPMTIYFAKFLVIVLMIAQFFVLFDIGIVLSAWLPALLVSGVRFPQAPLPLRFFMSDTAIYFFDCLPIIAAQYLLSLRFNNFLASIGIGFMAWVGALAALSWQYARIVPYAYTMLDYLTNNPGARIVASTNGMHYLAIGWFVLFTVAGYAGFVMKAQKG